MSRNFDVYTINYYFQVDSYTAHQRLSGTPTCMKLYDVAQSNSVNRSGSQHSEPMSTSSTENPSSSDKSQATSKQQFNLVKLFMKHKSTSNDGMEGIDQLDRSECWPSSSGGESGESVGEPKTLVSKSIITSPNSSLIKEDATEIYEDIQTTNKVNDDVLLEEESYDTNNQKIAFCDSETNLYATVNKSHPRRSNVNHNVSNSPSRIRHSKRSCSSQSPGTSVSISSCSESDGTQITKLNRAMHREPHDNKSTSTRPIAETVDRSMQTSMVLNTSQNKRSYKVVETSFLQNLKEGDCEKPVFVLYPSYALPDISFLNGRPNIFLNPIKVNISKNNSKKNKAQDRSKRPFSCNDVELLKKKGLNHIKDWDSLNFLLPMECKQLLSEVPEFTHHIKDKDLSKCVDKHCNTNNVGSKGIRNRPMSCDCNNLVGHNTTVSSSSSTATQPSSGFRGSSTMLTDSSAQNSPAPGINLNPLFVYRYDSTTSSEASCVSHPSVPKRTLAKADPTRIGKQGEIAPPRPPLPKSILRKSVDKTRKLGNTKRYSMLEMDELIQEAATCTAVPTTEHKTKRRSLQEPYYLQNDYRKNNDIAAKRLSQQFLDAADKDADYNEYYQDEGVGTESSLESGKSNELKFNRPHTPPQPKPRTKKMEYTEFPPPGALISSAELQELEDFLKLSGVDCLNIDDWDQNQVQKVRNEVSKFLQLKKSEEEISNSAESSGMSNKKSVSFANKPEPHIESQPSAKAIEDLKLTNPPNSPNISAILAQRLYQVNFIFGICSQSYLPLFFCEYFGFYYKFGLHVTFKYCFYIIYVLIFILAFLFVRRYLLLLFFT